jgi:hypothetical protein
MPKLPRWTAAEAEKELFFAGFELLRSKGSHRIYGKKRPRFFRKSTWSCRLRPPNRLFFGLAMVGELAALDASIETAKLLSTRTAVKTSGGLHARSLHIRDDEEGEFPHLVIPWKSTEVNKRGDPIV